MYLRRFCLGLLLFCLMVLNIGIPARAQSEEVVLIDVPVSGEFLITVPADWFLWTGEPVVTAAQEERANVSANIMVQSVYPSLTIPTTFARQYRQFIAVPSTPPEDGVVYMVIEIVPVTDLMVATSSEAAVTTAGLLRAVNAQSLATLPVNGRNASFGINRSGNAANVIVTYRFPIEGKMALVRIVGPDSWLTENVALVRLLATSFRRDDESIDEVAYEDFAGEPIPENFRLPSEAPAPVPTFDLTGGVLPDAESTPDVRVEDSGILPTPEGGAAAPTPLPPTQPPPTEPPPTSEPTAQPTSTLVATTPPPPTAQPTSTLMPTTPPQPTTQPTLLPAPTLAPTDIPVPVAQPVPGGQRDANGRCIIPEGWRQYVVQPGDTLFRVAVTFGSSIAAMRDANCITNVDFLPWGTIVYVPGSGGTTPSGATPAPAPTTLFAQGCTDPSTIITAPFAGQEIAGQFTISGTASLPDMSYYKIEIRPNFSEVYNFVGQSDQGVANGTLARLNSGTFGTGIHWIRLTVVDTTGNFPTPCTVPVVFR